MKAARRAILQFALGKELEEGEAYGPPPAPDTGFTDLGLTRLMPARWRIVVRVAGELRELDRDPQLEEQIRAALEELFKALCYRAVYCSGPVVSEPVKPNAERCKLFGLIRGPLA